MKVTSEPVLRWIREGQSSIANIGKASRLSQPGPASGRLNFSSPLKERGGKVSFSEHAEIAQPLDATIYFAHPFASWERGVNENTNGLIRQFFFKDRDLTLVSEQELTAVMNRLNHRPRKTLGFRAPHEIFFDGTISLTVALTSLIQVSDFRWLDWKIQEVFYG